MSRDRQNGPAGEKERILASHRLARIMNLATFKIISLMGALKVSLQEGKLNFRARHLPNRFFSHFHDFQ